MPSGKPVVAVFTKNLLNPAYLAARLGADRVAQRWGARVTHYVPRKPDDAPEQIELIGEALAARPDAMLLVAVHPTAINPSIREINAAGIPLVGYINRFTEGECVTYVGSEDYPLAKRIADYLCGKLAGSGEVVIVEGPRDSITSDERLRGFHDALRGFPGVRVAAQLRGDYQREPAREAMAQWLGEGRNVDGVLAANDVMALGAIDALRALRRACPVVGVNAIPEAIAAIRGGAMLATVDFNAMEMASVAMEAALRHLRGERVPREIILPVQIVDRANCAAWDKPWEDRVCLSWEGALAAGAN